MKQQVFKEKYPIYTITIEKDETSFKNTDEIAEYLKEKAQKHPKSEFIAIFDHYSHTKSLPNGEIDEKIIDAKNVIFCFGPKLLNPSVLAVRPRSIGICEYEKHFVLTFLEAPMEFANDIMQEWIKSIKN